MDSAPSTSKLFFQILGDTTAEEEEEEDAERKRARKGAEKEAEG